MTDTLGTAPPAGAVLAQARRLCEPGLREALTMLPAPLDEMAAYHFGWCDPSGVRTSSGWGKGLRAALALGAASACGAQPIVAVPAAIAVELIHNFTLIHDDVMDTDRLRRGRATVWAVWGVPQAICLGDALHALATRVLATTLPGPVATAAVARLESATVDLCRGQSEDCAFESRSDVPLEEYLTMAAGKTGALIGCATAMGALTARADEPTVKAFDTFGRELGLAFQLVDDILGIWGDPATTGKPVGADLVRRKRSFPVVAALASATSAAAELDELYRSARPIVATDASYAATLVETAGGRRSASRQAEEHIAAAIAVLPDPAAAQNLISLARLVTNRDR